jgi:hypothetical protein
MGRASTTDRVGCRRPAIPGRADRDDRLTHVARDHTCLRHPPNAAAEADRASDEGAIDTNVSAFAEPCTEDRQASIRKTLGWIKGSAGYAVPRRAIASEAYSWRGRIGRGLWSVSARCARFRRGGGDDPVGLESAAGPSLEGRRETAITAILVGSRSRWPRSRSITATTSRTRSSRARPAPSSRRYARRPSRSWPPLITYRSTSSGLRRGVDERLAGLHRPVADRLE